MGVDKVDISSFKHVFGHKLAVISQRFKIFWYSIHLTFLTNQYTNVNLTLHSVEHICNHALTYIRAWNDNFRPSKNHVFSCFERFFDQNVLKIKSFWLINEIFHLFSPKFENPRNQALNPMCFCHNYFRFFSFTSYS